MNHQSDCGSVESVKCIAYTDLDVDWDLANASLEFADQWSLLVFVLFVLLPIIAQLWALKPGFYFHFAFHFAANLAACMTPHCFFFLAAVGHFGIFFNWRPTCNWPMILQLRNALCRMSMIDYESGMSILYSFHTFYFLFFGCIACPTFCCASGFVIYLAY